MRLISLVVLCLLSSASLTGENNALHIIQRAFQSDEANEKVARNYTFHERIEQKFFNKKNEVRRAESKTYDITLLDGSEYKRLIAKDDQPLNEKREAKEQRKLQESIEKMHSETAKARKKRRAKIEKERQEQREFIGEIIRAYDFRLIGEEQIDGIDTHVIFAEPRPDYRPAVKKAGVLRKLRGTLWIAKDDYGWVKAEIDTIEDFSWGLFLIKFRKGAKIRFSQQCINEEVWLMDSWNVRLRGRAGLVLGFNGEFSGAYSNFRKFSTESTVTFDEAAQ